MRVAMQILKTAIDYNLIEIELCCIRFIDQELDGLNKTLDRIQTGNVQNGRGGKILQVLFFGRCQMWAKLWVKGGTKRVELTVATVNPLQLE